MAADPLIRRQPPRVATAQGPAEVAAAGLHDAFADCAPGLVLFFAADGAAVAPLSEDLSRRLGPGCRVLGCSSAGAFAFDGYDDTGVVAIAFPAQSFRAEAVWLSRLRQHMALDWMVTLRSLGDRFRAVPGRSRFGLLLIDGMSRREELVTATVESTLPELLVLGGSAGDGLRFGQTHLAMNGEARTESALFCMIATDFAVEEVIFDHFVPVGQKMVVSEAEPENRLIREINAEPAAEEFARLIGVPVSGLGPRAFAENPLLERLGGRHFVRAISGVTPDGGLSLMSSVETGAILTIGRAESLTEGLRQRMDQIGPAELILGFDCILRRIAVEQAGAEASVGDLCRRYRIAGFNTYGEQHGGIHVNQTFVGLAFLDDRGRMGISMLRDSDDLARRVEKLQKINVALMQRLERVEETRGPAYALTRTAAMLEREVVARNRDLERALADLAAINSELASAREVADEANRAKTRFLRAASHDLLQPLSAAKLFLSHLSEMATESLHKALVSHLAATIDSAEELIRALSNIAKLDSQSFQMNRSAVAMGRLFRRLIIDMQPLATSRGIDLRFVASGATVDSDPVFLRQIAQNLIANALKYTTGKKVLVGIRQAGEAVWLEVLDAGPGIHAKDQDRIFNEFERLSRSEEPGTGLGLSIVRRACQQLGHGLELHSVPGKGSRFRVRLPRWTEAPDKGAEGKGRRRETRESDAVFAGRRVLVVENDPGMRQAFAYLLGGWGMEPVVVGCIAAARKAVVRAVPDIILSDYRLDRDETGIAAIDLLRRDLGRKIPAVLISVEADEAMRQEAQELRVEVLAKPVVETDLKRALRQALRGRA